MDSISLQDFVKQEYRAYQIYTLMDRAIPYLQDGLKPCQRRILFTLWKNKNKGLIKVSSATGLVLTLHPHGPASIETSLVNLAQDFSFSNNYPLIDKKGYFGERMETSPAAGRYIECQSGKLAEILLFDDMNQVDMIPNYDEKVMEPVALLPKLPLMLLNGSEGIGTGFSSVIPSFHHKDVIESMIHVVEKNKAKKIRPFVRGLRGDLVFDDQKKIVTKIHFAQEGDQIFIVDLPKGYDAQRIYKHLNKFIDKDELKDFIDSSADNHIRIELIFKKGQQPSLEEVEKLIGAHANIVPNYTLISERGVKVFDTAEEIILLFTQFRLKVVRKRYELLTKEAETRLQQNEDIIRFIEEKHYAQAQKSENRKSFVEYLQKKDFRFADYLADMAVYRMTKEEVQKRVVSIQEDQGKIKDYKKILKSEDLIKEKLIEELRDVGKQLDRWMEEKEKQSLPQKKSKKK
jgi:DNA gyrase subunit A